MATWRLNLADLPTQREHSSSSPNDFDLGVDSFADPLPGKLLACARPVREFGKRLGFLVNLGKFRGVTSFRGVTEGSGN